MKKPRIVTALLLAIYLLSVTPSISSPRGVVMNFNDVDISTMVKFISELTGKNFVLDERVKGKISIYSPSKLSNDEAFSLFTSVLELKGFTLLQTGRVYKVVPVNTVKQSGMKLLTKHDRLPLGDTFVARVFPLEQISAQEALTFLQPVISKDGHIGSFGPSNMLLVVDSASNIQKISEILFLIDTPQRREGGELIYLRHGSADNIAKVLQEWLSGRAPRQIGNQTAVTNSGSVQIIADTRLNAVLLFGPEKDKKDVRKLIAQLDVVPPSASSKITVHYLEHADATEIAKVLDTVIKGSAATPAAISGPAASAPVSPFESGKVSITPDKGSNALVIMASPADQQHIIAVIKQLDRRRRQVFVEAVIAEVSLNRLEQLGVQWGMIGGGSNGTVSVAGMYDPLSTFDPLLKALTAMKNGGFNIPSLSGTAVNFTVVLKALQEAGALNVLSTPTILTSDNKEAEIFVGENVPFMGQSNMTTGGVYQQSVERKDTGITLKITPQISEGDSLRLDIYQEISDIKGDTTIGNGSTDKITTKRSAKTAVVVKNEETVSIGGLIQEREEVTDDKVPLLGDIPWLGWAFKSTSKQKKRTNLIILLTPRIIRDASDMRKVSDSQRDRFKQKSTQTTLGFDLK